MKRSSTSSSEAATRAEGGEAAIPRGGFPWAFALALLMLVSVEALIRYGESRGYYPYAFGAAEYHALRGIVDDRGNPDIVFFGSSNGREAIVTPMIQEWLAQRQNGAFRAGNYSCAGAGASEDLAILEFMIRRGPPKFLVFTVTPRVVMAYETRDYESALFMDLAGWRTLYDQDRTAAFKLLPVLVRSELGRYYRTLRYRQWGAVVAQWLRYRTIHSSPASGAESIWHRVSPDEKLGQIDRAAVDRLIAQLEQNGAEPGSILRFSPQKWAEFNQILDLSANHGIGVAILEVPVSQPLFDTYSPEKVETFRREMAAIAASKGVKFITFDELGLDLTNEDFRDISHLNLRGARKYTRAVIDRVLEPELSGLLAPRPARARGSGSGR